MTQSPGFRHALIMAAGRGLRLRPLTDSMPKAMAPYEGSTLIARGIAQLRPLIDHIHVTVGYRGAMLAEHVITHGAATVFNTDGQGNCWWLFNTFVSLLDEAVIVLTCDNVVELDLEFIALEYERLDRPPCMLVPVEPVEGISGDYVVRRGDAVVALGRERPTDAFCSGIQVVNPVKVRSLVPPRDDFVALWAELIAAGSLLASRTYPHSWFSIDTLEHLLAATRERPMPSDPST